MNSSIAAALRSRTPQIIERYLQACQDIDELRGLEKSVLIDHLPEVLDALATWVDSSQEQGSRAGSFALLAEGHALQRLGFHISLETLTAEYILLRTCLLTELLDVSPDDRTRTDLIALHLALDQGVMEAVRRYTQQRDLVRERFIGILGHDLRGPLSAISAGAGALLAIDLDARGTRIAARISSATQRMARMINDLLDFARGHLGGGIPANPTRNDMALLCRQAVDEAATAHADRSIRLQVEGDLTGTWDSDRIAQALGNLIGNAITHGQDPITVRAQEADDRRAITVHVSNRGSAIPPELIPRVFDPFRGGERGIGSAGLGLGLYIVQQIARTHGGTCTVASTEEETTFTLHLPRVPLGETPGRP